MLRAMFEVLVLAAIILFFPPGQGHVWPLIFALAVTLPGIYAMLRGAPFVPTMRATQERMFGLANIKNGETVYDLGCGDGRLVFAAAKKGARAIGYEFSVPTFVLAKLLSFFHARSSIRFANMWKQDYKNADVLFCYLLTDTMQTFKKVVWPQLKPGTRVVSHAFKMKGIEPSKTDHDVVLYIKPAKDRTTVSE